MKISVGAPNGPTTPAKSCPLIQREGTSVCTRLGFLSMQFAIFADPTVRDPSVWQLFLKG